MVDVAGSGEVGRAEMAAALIDWRAFKVRRAGGWAGQPAPRHVCRQALRLPALWLHTCPAQLQPPAGKPTPSWQDTFHDRWVECARRAFAELDADGTGELSADEIAAAFASHLSPYEVDAAVHQVG